MKISLALYCVLTLFLLQGQAQSLEQILTQNENAMGGKKLKSFQSFKIISRVEEFGSYVADPFTAYYQREKKLAIEAHINPHTVYREGIAGTVAWEQPDPSVPKKQVIGRPFISLYRAAQWPNPIRSIKQFQEEGNDVKWKGTKGEKDGSLLFVLELRLKGDSLTRDYYLDSKTYRIVKQRDHRPLHPAEREKTIETRYENYKNVNGLFIAFTIAEWDYGLNSRLTLTEIQEVKLEPELDENFFGLKTRQ